MSADQPLQLSEREHQLLLAMAAGRKNREIARQLYVTEDTVKTHASRLFRKLGVHDRAAAVAVGYRSGLLHIEKAPPHPSTVDAPSVTLTVTDADADRLMRATWPGHPNPDALRPRLLEGLRRLAGA